MTPAARLAAAIDILDALKATAQPADRMLKDWFRTRRFAGSKDRAAIGERVFTVLRHTRPLGYRMGGEDGRAWVIGSLLEEGLDIAALDALFSGDGYGPAALSEEERARIVSPPASQAPLHIDGDFPQFLESELSAAFGNSLLEEMRALQTRASIDLRVNTLKTTREALAEKLRAENFAVEFAPWSPLGLRLAPGSGSAGLSRSPLFVDGQFEFQDEAAQICAVLCGAQAGQRVLDLAAGAGGKSLALSALMQNQGEIVACDIRPAPLQELIARADRGGDKIIQTQITAGTPPTGPFDVVLVDAPCSGSGTWRRQPELKLRFSPARLAELIRIQDELLEQAATRVKGDGRLVYATCSILPSENEARITAFLSRHPDFAILPANTAWNGPPLPGLDTFFKATPLSTGTDGFFTALLSRTGAKG